MSPSADRLRLADASIRIDSMPTAGRELKLEVSAGERAVLATALDVVSVDALSVTLHAVRFRGGFRVTGRLTATVTQESVVSFAPVTQQISEPIDRVFLPGGEKPYAGTAGAEVFVDLEGEDVPDHFEGAEADLSDMIIEVLALAIDPYPRAEGEAIGELRDPGDEPDESPFARLKALKDQDNRG